jgi:hypothetical protein
MEKMRRFAKDLSLALDVSSAEAAKILQNTVAKVCNRDYETGSGGKPGDGKETKYDGGIPWLKRCNLPG